MPKQLEGLWFLSHPLAGDVEANKQKAAELARKLALEHPNAVIFSPVTALSFLREPEDRELALRYCEEYLRSDLFKGIILPPGWTESQGCIKELSIARDIDMKVIFLNSKNEIVSKVV